MKTKATILLIVLVSFLIGSRAAYGADRYWVGADDDWHDSNNWSTTSGGAGGAGVPTSSDDVYFDGNGYALCWPSQAIACNNMYLTSSMTESLIIGEGGIIYGDIDLDDGYISFYDKTTELKGSLDMSGGQIAYGFENSNDKPTLELSGASKTWAITGAVSVPSVPNLSVTGSYTFSNSAAATTILVNDSLDVSGTATIEKDDWFTLEGPFDSITGTIDGAGRFRWYYGDTYTVPTGGTIEPSYFRFIHDGSDSESVDEDLDVDGWSNVNDDWTHEGTEPWIDSDDGDTSRILLDADGSSVGLYDEYYTVEDLPAGDPVYTSFTPTKVTIHFKARLVPGAGGSATLVILRGYLWDGSTWQDGGTATFHSTTYTDDDCSTSLHGSIDTLSKINAMRMKIEVDTVIGGGADKGDIAITYAYVEVQGTAYYGPEVTINARTWDATDTEFEYTEDEQTFIFEADARHRFNGKVTIHGNDTAINNAYLDFATNDAEVWVDNSFGVDNNAFPNGTFNVAFGNGTHVFRGTVEFFYSYSSATAHLSVDPGEGTIILYPKGRILVKSLERRNPVERLFAWILNPRPATAQTGIILLNVQYRLSRVYSGGQDYQTYYRVWCYNPAFRAGAGPYFVEGFGAHEFLVESHGTTWSFRKQTLSPQMLYDFDRIRVIGGEINDPVLRSRLSLTTAPFGLDVGEEYDIFNVQIRDADASHGIDIDVYNGVEAGTNTSVNFYDRDVRTVVGQRNVLGARARLSPTPPPEKIVEPIMETL